MGVITTSTNLQPFPVEEFWPYKSPVSLCKSCWFIVIIAVDRTTEQLYIIEPCPFLCVCVTVCFMASQPLPPSNTLSSWKVPGRLLVPGLFGVRWLVSKREALMAHCAVYFSLSTLGMASLYPDAGISWSCV